MSKFLRKGEYPEGGLPTQLSILIEILAEIRALNVRIDQITNRFDSLADALASLTCASRLKMSPGFSWEALQERKKT